jgi:hypothetical protein
VGGQNFRSVFLSSDFLSSGFILGSGPSSRAALVVDSFAERYNLVALRFWENLFIFGKKGKGGNDSQRQEVDSLRLITMYSVSVRLDTLLTTNCKIDRSVT